jgi:uncharacterized protein YecT (DUF1311 family)
VYNPVSGIAAVNWSYLNSETESRMRQILVSIAVALALGCAGTTVHAQTQLSFDQNIDQKPNVKEMVCDKELAPPEDDSISAALSWTLQCADLDLRIEKNEFASLSKAAKKGSKDERDAYNALVNAFESYRRLHVEIETKGCGGGNGCPAYMAQEEAQCNYEFLRMAEGLRGSGFPSFSAHEFSAADAALNAAYKQELPDHSAQCPHVDTDEFDACVSRSEFVAMERAWIRYRDAWVAYGAIKWPTVSANSWRAYLTLQHTGPHPGLSGIGAEF